MSRLPGAPGALHVSANTIQGCGPATSGTSPAVGSRHMETLRASHIRHAHRVCRGCKGSFSRHLQRAPSLWGGGSTRHLSGLCSCSRGTAVGPGCTTMGRSQGVPVPWHPLACVMQSCQHKYEHRHSGDRQAVEPLPSTQGHFCWAKVCWATVATCHTCCMPSGATRALLMPWSLLRAGVTLQALMV